MTRIVAGTAGSLSLKVPKSGTRPTSDRVREAIFSAIEARGGVDGVSVLDLYAGSGALGLEAASRGAIRVVLVERATAAAQICRQNAAAIAKVSPAGLSIEVVARPSQGYLEHATGPFDLVFIDPPYELGEEELAANLLALVPLLAPDAMIAVERSGRSPEPRWPDGMAREREKSYGETTIWWAAPAENA